MYFRIAMRVLMLAAILVLPATARAEWVVVKQPEEDDLMTTIARTTNEQGYILEIYRDAVGAVRSRFSLGDGLLHFADKSCPTYQIDRGQASNRSTNNAACLATGRWAEYVLGYVVNSNVESRNLLAIMNGINVAFRFRLDSGDYRETQFSLLGSKRSLTEALGVDVTVSLPR